MKVLIPIIVLCVTAVLTRNETLQRTGSFADGHVIHPAKSEEDQLVLPGRILQGKHTELSGKINDLIFF